MSLDFLRRLQVGFNVATGVVNLQPCGTFGKSGFIDDQYADAPRTDGFPNPWHIGTMDMSKYPLGVQLMQTELEMLAFMFGLVVQLKPRLVFESGTNIGLMARALGAGCYANGFGRVVTAEVDLAMCEYARGLCLNLPVEVRNTPALDCQELKEADLVFIDSSYESRSQEHKLVKPGAVFVYHDATAEPWIANELINEDNVVMLDSPRGFAMVRKTK